MILTFRAAAFLFHSFPTHYFIQQSPVCALQAPDGSKFCAILCSPSSLRKESVTDEQCGPMTCQIVPGQSAMGICTYPSAKALLEE